MGEPIGDNGSMSESPQESRATIRRAPKISKFMVIGGGLGAIVTFILTALFPSDPQVGFGALFGYFLLYGVPAGIILGAIVGLILDRRSRQQATTVSVEHETIVEPEPEPEPGQDSEPALKPELEQQPDPEAKNIER